MSVFDENARSNIIRMFKSEAFTWSQANLLFSQILQMFVITKMFDFEQKLSLMEILIR